MIPSICFDLSVDRSLCVIFILRLKILATKVFFVVVLLNVFPYQQGSHYVSIEVAFILCKPTPVFLPGKSHGRRNLVGYSPWGRRESDTTERLHSLTHAL